MLLTQLKCFLQIPNVPTVYDITTRRRGVAHVLIVEEENEDSYISSISETESRKFSHGIISEF